MAVNVTRDGETVFTARHENEAFAWLLRHSPSSVYHSLRHEGYRFVDADTGEETPYSAEARVSS